MKAKGGIYFFTLSVGVDSGGRIMKLKIKQT